MAQHVIKQVEAGSNDESKMFLKLLENAYSEAPIESLLSEFDVSSNESKIAQFWYILLYQIKGYNFFFQVLQEKFFEKAPLPNNCVKLTCSS